jgi:hypothetical protein
MKVSRVNCLGVTSRWLTDEERFEAWGKSGELDDIARDMKHSANSWCERAERATTQKVQKDIVDKLDKLIKDQEDKMSGASAQSQPQGAEGNQKIGSGWSGSTGTGQYRHGR